MPGPREWGSACGPDCGYCGACTSGPRVEEPEPIVCCASCGMPIERVSIAIYISKYVSAVACSENCYNEFQAGRREQVG